MVVSCRQDLYDAPKASGEKLSQPENCTELLIESAETHIANRWCKGYLEGSRIPLRDRHDRILEPVLRGRNAAHGKE